MRQQQKRGRKGAFACLDFSFSSSWCWEAEFKLLQMSKNIAITAWWLVASCKEGKKGCSSSPETSATTTQGAFSLRFEVKITKSENNELKGNFWSRLCKDGSTYRYQYVLSDSNVLNFLHRVACNKDAAGSETWYERMRPEKGRNLIGFPSIFKILFHFCSAPFKLLSQQETEFQPVSPPALLPALSHLPDRTCHLESS